MSYRSAKFVMAMLAAILAGANLTAVAGDTTGTTETCLLGPKGTAPAGGHWYYRIDRATKRQCWYVGDEKGKTGGAGRPDTSSPAAASAPPQQNANVRKSIADARAELPLPQARVDQDSGVFGGQRMPSEAVNVENSSRVDPQRSVVASRWPESSGVNAPSAAAPATVNPDTNLRSNSKAVPAAASAAIGLAAADASSQKHFGSIQMLLIVIVGALSLAGLMGSAIYRFGGMRWNGRREIRRPLWEPAGISGSATDDPQGRIALMTARLSRSTAA